VILSKGITEITVQINGKFTQIEDLVTYTDDKGHKKRNQKIKDAARHSFISEARDTTPLLQTPF
jgi:hypothetical protein